MSESQQDVSASSSQHRPVTATPPAQTRSASIEPSSQSISKSERHGFQLPSWCFPPGKVKTTISKTGCPVLDDLAEKIHQSGSCSGHQTPSQRLASSNTNRSAIAHAAAKLTGKSGDKHGQSDVSHMPPLLSRSRSFPAATTTTRQVYPNETTAGSSLLELEVLDEDGCSADTVRAAADAITADDPDFHDTVPYLETVSNQLKEHCLNQMIGLKQKLLREFAEVLCIVERKFTLNYAESLAEAREQQTVARYYQAQMEKYKTAVDKMAMMMAKKAWKLKIMRIFFAWYRLAKLNKKVNNSSSTEQRESSDGIDVEYIRTEEVGSKIYENKLTAKLSQAFAEKAHAEECRKYHSGPPCKGRTCRFKLRAENKKNKRIQSLEAQLQASKRREAELLEMKQAAEHKYRVAVMRGLGGLAGTGSGGDSCPSSGCAQMPASAQMQTTTITRRRIAGDSDDSTLPPARVRRTQSEVRRSSSTAKAWRRRARSRAASRGLASQARHLRCTPPQGPPWAETAECITSKTLRRPRVRVCAETTVPRRHGLLAEARCRAAAAAANALINDLPEDLPVSNSSEITFDIDRRDRPRKTAEVTEKWRHIARC